MAGGVTVNLAIFAHVDAGKTTLTEQFLYETGAIRAPGRVDDGTAQTDYLDVERERGISVRAAETSLSLPWGRINLIDTPGHTDFAGEAERSFAAIDGAILLVSAVEGVQAYTERLWQALCAHRVPTLLFFNKIDRAGSHVRALADEIGALGTRRVLLLDDIENEGEKNARPLPIPDESERLLEAAADFSDEAAEYFLAHEPGARPEGADTAADGFFASCVARGEITPAFAGSALNGVGVARLLDAVRRFLPADDGRSADGPLSALVYRVEHDKTMGRVAHVRLFGGRLRARDALTYLDREDMPDKRPDEKISQIRRFNGQKYTDVGDVCGGDIAALCGLRNVRVFDAFGVLPGREKVKLADPYLCVRVTPAEPAQLTALVEALGELEAEDPLLSVKWEKSAREIQISITGQIECEILSELLRTRYGLTAVFSAPTVIYKETPAKAAYGFEAYTMPKPCWAVVKFLLEPLPRGSGVEYDGGNVPHDKLFYKYQEHIRRSFFESLGQGLYGWEVTDFRATLADGGHHTIHTHPLDFFVATPMAFLDGLRAAGSTLLEPILRAKIRVGEEHLGRVLGDITRMRGEFDSPVIRAGDATVEALIPAATSLDYPITVASMTGGRGRFSAVLDGYRDCPPELGRAVPYRGVCPLDRSKWILYKRGAYTESIDQG